MKEEEARKGGRKRGWIEKGQDARRDIGERVGVDKERRGGREEDEGGTKETNLLEVESNEHVPRDHAHSWHHWNLVKRENFRWGYEGEDQNKRTTKRKEDESVENVLVRSRFEVSSSPKSRISEHQVTRRLWAK